MKAYSDKQLEKPKTKLVCAKELIECVGRERAFLQGGFRPRVQEKTGKPK